MKKSNDRRFETCYKEEMEKIKTFDHNDYHVARWMINQMTWEQKNKSLLSTHNMGSLIPVIVKIGDFKQNLDFLLEDGFELKINGTYVTKEEFDHCQNCIDPATTINKFVKSRFKKLQWKEVREI
jgi:hypothetical protein